ncbi:hypothetical protein QUB05_01115 [Microcoleus sp. F10-C6]|uniref:hypothetical protein n=1 Tax=unclassified Microcoleus TaxID=2642155 RepID=UPI002FCED8CD
MKFSDDRPFTPKSDRTFSPSLFYNLLRSPALKFFEVRSPFRQFQQTQNSIALSSLLKKQIERGDRISQHFQ